MDIWVNTLDPDGAVTSSLTTQTPSVPGPVRAEMKFAGSASTASALKLNIAGVSEIEMLRYLSLKAGELLIKTDTDYRFTADTNWDEWKKMVGLPPADKQMEKNCIGLAVIPERPTAGL